MTYLNILWEPSAYVTVVILGLINLIVSYKWLSETKGINLDDVRLHSDVVADQPNGIGEDMEKAKMLKTN